MGASEPARAASASGAAKGAAQTVSELTARIQGTLSGAFADVWVRGQVTGARMVSSGHVYLSLKDEGAVLPAVVWRSLAARLRFDLEDGIEVVCRGTVDVYPPHGRYQLIVNEVAPLGMGALQIAFEQMRKRLEAEGLFDPAKKIAIPFMPRRIAIVTARTGAAVRDLVTVIHRRFARVEIILIAVRVQGQGAAEEIARGLALADRHARADVIVVGRGGGSPEDLWAFNEESVARAIFACVTPVVSAVGHEIDFTIADLVADLRAATPSQAGELVVAVRDELLADLERRASRVSHLVRMRLDRAWQRLEAIASRPALRDAHEAVEARRERLQHLAARLAAKNPVAELLRRRDALVDAAARARFAVQARLARARASGGALASRLAAAAPATSLERARGRAADLSSRAATSVRRRVALAFAGYEARRASIEALSPLKVLERGWSLTRRAAPRDDAGQLVKSVGDVVPGDRLETQVGDGVLESRVEAVRRAPRTAERPAP